jgi:hypothetical protein
MLATSLSFSNLMGVLMHNNFFAVIAIVAFAVLIGNLFNKLVIDRYLPPPKDGPYAPHEWQPLVKQPKWRFWRKP